jgi:hypothetical protein
MTPNPFASFQPNADELLRRLAQHIDAQMLDEIAAADYGHDAKEHLAHLQQIHADGSFAVPMRWHPQEVLELIRWSEPEDPSWKPGAPGERGHWMRAFACASLLRAAGESENSELRNGWNQTLIQLMGSLRTVAQELYPAAAAFLAWLIPQVEQYDDTEELGFFAIGLLWLALNLPADIPDDVVVALSERITAEAKLAFEEGHGPHAEGWLLGTTFYNLQHGAWKRLGLELTQLDLRDRALATREWVSLIGSELVGRG